ncbi:MAG: tyrosine-type recombinase/integrase [Acidobacteria bacterium]|nr:tyrosine-type recombinase/integrase [Acidobacteriota bacterium]
MYACGLRLLEGTRLQVPDVDSSRMLLHIHGKSKKDRYVPLPTPTLELLRAYWRTHRSPLWLFPAPSYSSVWRCFCEARGSAFRC